MGTTLLLNTNVLIVDDEAEFRDLLRRVLTNHGADCVAVSSAAEARTALGSDARFHVVLTDLSMPGGSGVEVVRAAAELSPESAVLVVTGDDDPDHAMTLIDLGISPSPFATTTSSSAFGAPCSG
jgi:DNA-binding NtrC family response regulator